QRRGNVVGQVADDTHAGRKAREVELERIGFVDRETRHFAQPGGEVAVDLDRMQLARALDQRRAERALAGADLDDAFAGPRRDGIDDAREHLALVQEMLPESLTRAMRARWQAAAP